MSIASKKILITGGTGFIGRNILESLGNRYEFLAPTIQELNLRKENAVLEYLEKNRLEIVIQLATVGGFGRESKEGPNAILAENLQIFFNLIRAQKKGLFKRMIFFGSGADYDKRRELKKVKETDFGKFVPTDEYSLYKYICSEYTERNEDIVCLRLFGAYGKYEGYESKFISNSVVKNILKQDIVINQNVVYDHLFIDDLMPVLEYFIEQKPKFKSYNVTPDKSIDLTGISNIINEISDYKSKIIVLKEGLNKEYTGDNNRLKEEIPNLKFTNYKEGIKKLFNYYQENIKNINKDTMQL